MRLLSTALVATLLLGLGVTASAGPAPEVPAARDRILELMDTVRNGLFTEDKEKALGELGSVTDEARLTKFGVPAFLVEVIKSADYVPRVRTAAVKALTGVMKFVPESKDAALTALTVRLNDGNDQLAVRRAVADALGGILDPQSPGDRNSFTVLIRIVRDRKDDPALVGAALRALGRTGYRDAINLVVAAISDTDPEIRSAGLEALQLLLSSGRGAVNVDVVRLLITVAGDDKYPLEVRELAMGALVGAINAGVKPEEVAAPLAEILGKATEPKLAEAVIKVLARVPVETSVDALKKAYEAFQKPAAAGQDFAAVRELIARALGEYLNPLARKGLVPAGQSAAALLITMCRKEPNPKVVTAAVYSLGNMCDARYDRREVVRELIETLASDSDKGVVQTVRETLKLVTNREIAKGVNDPKEAAKEWKKWYEANANTLLPRS
jgi:HEAT repeat protein